MGHERGLEGSVPVSYQYRVTIFPPSEVGEQPRYGYPGGGWSTEDLQRYLNEMAEGRRLAAAASGLRGKINSII